MISLDVSTIVGTIHGVALVFALKEMKACSNVGEEHKKTFDKTSNAIDFMVRDLASDLASLIAPLLADKTTRLQQSEILGPDGRPLFTKDIAAPGKTESLSNVYHQHVSISLRAMAAYCELKQHFGEWMLWTNFRRRFLKYSSLLQVFLGIYFVLGVAKYLYISKFLMFWSLVPLAVLFLAWLTCEAKIERIHQNIVRIVAEYSRF